MSLDSNPLTLYRVYHVQYRVMSKSLTTVQIVYFVCGIVATVDRLNNITRVSATKVPGNVRRITVQAILFAIVASRS